MASCRSEGAALQSALGELGEEPSTAFSQDAEAGVKWKPDTQPAKANRRGRAAPCWPLHVTPFDYLWFTTAGESESTRERLRAKELIQ